MLSSSETNSLITPDVNQHLTQALHHLREIDSHGNGSDALLARAAIQILTEVPTVRGVEL